MSDFKAERWPPGDETHTVRAIDSHTGGEPTRVVVSGGPNLGGGTAAEKLERLRAHYDHFRAAVVNEPRGSDVLVGALLVEPSEASCAAAVIFFNNVGYIGMCGHGTIGVVTTLAHLGCMHAGCHRIETPVGIVETQLHESGEVSVQNVPSYRHAKDVEVQVAGYGRIRGDIAWGGNWFYLVEGHGQALEFANLDRLMDFTRKVRAALEEAHITGRDGQPIDHIELCGPSSQPGVDSRSFVLCPGGAYDRSPCGTGTSARLACLAEDDLLQEGELWRQESIIGSVFEASYRRVDQGIVPTIRGRAFVTADASLILNAADPYCWGIECQNTS